MLSKNSVPIDIVILLMVFILSLIGCSKEPITEESRTTTSSITSITSDEKVEKNKKYYQNLVFAALERGNDDVIGGIPAEYLGDIQISVAESLSSWEKPKAFAKFELLEGGKYFQVYIYGNEDLNQFFNSIRTSPWKGYKATCYFHGVTYKQVKYWAEEKINKNPENPYNWEVVEYNENVVAFELYSKS